MDHWRVSGAIAMNGGGSSPAARRLGRAIHAMDALIAGTAQIHELTLVTRNAADFKGSVKTVVIPWTPQSSRASPGSQVILIGMLPR